MRNCRYFLFFILWLFSMFHSHALICVFDCTKSKCDRNPQVAQTCYDKCPRSRNACSQGLQQYQNSQATGGQQSDPALIGRFHDLFFEALNAEKDAGKDKWPKVIGESPTPDTARKQIQRILQYWEGQYLGILKRTPDHIKNLKNACEKNQEQCGTFKDQGMVRDLFCMPKTVKKCLSSFRQKFPNQKLQIVLASEDAGEDSGDEDE